MHAFEGILEFEGLLFTIWHGASIPLYHFVKERHAQNQSSKPPLKIVVKQIKAGSISQAGLLFELHVSVILEGIGIGYCDGDNRRRKYL